MQIAKGKLSVKKLIMHTWWGNAHVWVGEFELHKEALAVYLLLGESYLRGNEYQKQYFTI